MADLEAASVEDVRDFHNTFYVPANATVAIVGDFDPATTRQMVNQYFGRVPKADKPVPRDIPKEPAQTKEKRAVVTESWPLPAVVVGYHVTYDGHPDAYPLHMTAKILSDGNSARIIRELIYNKRIALTAFGSGNITEDPNLFYAVAVLQPGRTAAEAEKALIEEFEKLKREPVLTSELQRAKNQWARDYIIGRESIQDKAMHLAHAAVIHNDITTADGEFDIFTRVTTADVRRVARTYFNDTNRLVLHILPRGGGSR
jgi:zinc protease